MLRFLTAGESHGKAEVAILEGMPSGLSVSTSDIQKELDKRRGGLGRGGRGKIETDNVEILSGVRFGKTLGSPIALIIKNLDFENWKEIMPVDDKTQGVKLPHLRGVISNPRPGHADLAGCIKYKTDDIRNIIERSSARETVMRVGVGAICKKLLEEFNLEIASHTIQIGKIILNKKTKDFESIKNAYIDDPDIHCIDKNISQQMRKEIINNTVKKDTLGGIIEIVAHNVPVGLGSFVHFDRRLDGRIAQVLMSIPSVKAVEIGNGIENASLSGSRVHDEIFYDRKFFRRTNNAGGLEGGVTNGEDIICRIFLKPISTVGNPLKTVDIKSKKAAHALIERSDICVVPRCGVISESMLAFVLADAFMEKFGGDSLEEIKHNFEGFRNSINILL